MDLVSIVLRIFFAWLVIHALLRVSGKRTIKQGDVASFVVAIIVGDMFDDVFWAEVPVAQFVVAVGVLVLMHVVVSFDSFHRGPRAWQRTPGTGR